MDFKTQGAYVDHGGVIVAKCLPCESAMQVENNIAINVFEETSLALLEIHESLNLEPKSSSLVEFLLGFKHQCYRTECFLAQLYAGGLGKEPLRMASCTDEGTGTS
jgi:hypothetical protein